MISDKQQFPHLPHLAVRPEAREVFENTVAVGGSHAFGVMIGFDAFRIAVGQEPATFTRRGVMRWMEAVSQPYYDDGYSPEDVWSEDGTYVE